MCGYEKKGSSGVIYTWQYSSDLEDLAYTPDGSRTASPEPHTALAM